MVLQAFIDDSGNKRDQHFVLGGFVGTYENWMRFEKDWAKELAESPTIAYFKLSQARALKDEFDGVDRDDAEEKVLRLARIVKYHALLRVTCVADRKEYDRFIKGNFFAEIDDPYFLCFYQLVCAVIAYQRRHGWNTKIDFIFDEQGNLGNDTRDWWSVLKRILPPRYKPYLGSPPIFRDDKCFVPLQGADLLANSIRRHLLENKNLIVPMRPELQLLNEMWGIHRRVNAADMSKGFVGIKNLHRP